MAPPVDRLHLPRIVQGLDTGLIIDPDKPLYITFSTGKKIRIDMTADGIRVPLADGVRINVEAKDSHSIIRFSGG